MDLSSDVADANTNSTIEKNKRVLALDVVRGLAVMGMILVVSPGSWSHRLSILNHAPWHGYSPADLVFPLFLFAVGAAMALGFPSNRPLSKEYLRIFRRTFLLIFLGLFLNLLPSFDFAHLRIPGILQRIALCYALASVLILIFSKTDGGYRYLSSKAVFISIVALLVGWALLLAFTSAPGHPMGSVSEGGTLASWIDRELFTINHLWPYGTDAEGRVVYDPEGLLATFPAAANVLIGALFFHWIGRSPNNERLKYALALGVLLLVSGHILDPAHVINKRIWTSSFALTSSGWAILIYCTVFGLSKISRIRILLRPAIILGANAILAFSLSQVFGAFSGTHIAGTTPQNFGFNTMLSLVHDPVLASFLCAAGIVCIITVIIFPLHRNKIHLRL